MQTGIQNYQKQRGAALLAITAILLVVASMGALTMSNVTQVEQRVSGNDVRLKEVYAAAVGGLEYGNSWLQNNFTFLTFTDADSDGESEAGDTASPTALANLTLNADGYARTITYTLRTSINPVDVSMPRIIDITSTATAVNDSHVTKTVSTTTMLASTNFFSPDSENGMGFSGPPVVVEDCLDTITGTPDAVPLNGISIGTTQGTADDVCLDEGLLDLNGGGKQAITPSQSLWDTIFGPDTTHEDILYMQQLAPDKVFVVDNGYPYYPAVQPSLIGIGDNWNADVGTLTEPVILYFPAGSSRSCTLINGNTDIYGVVYYADTSCTSNGFGGGNIYGTVAKAGDISQLNANTLMVGTDLDFGGDSGGTDTTIDIGITKPQFTEIPGSWRDF